MTQEENTEAKECDRFGLCPRCFRADYYMNVGREHWFVCDTHKTKWFAGDNLFSSWRHESDEDFARNALLLEEYERVEPFYYPQEP